MASFDWQTEEDGAWGSSSPINQPQPEEDGRKWLPVILAVFGMVLLSGLLYWQIRGRIGGAEEVRNADIVAAHNLLVYAADRQDPSVLLRILPVENGPWTGIQRALAAQGLLLDPWPLGIQRTDEEPVIADIELSPDLQEADVTVEIPYQVQNQGRSESFRLLQVHQYQLSGEWRWAEPDDEYWGGPGQEVYESPSIVVLYPPRDEEIVRRIVDDLPGILGDICGRPGQPACGFAMNFMIYFERKPAVWTDLAAGIEENGSYIPAFSPSSIRNGMVTLPAPSLVGLPVDEAGYQALLRGYASHLLSAVLAELHQEECCPEDLTFANFLEAEMARRGIGFWPPPALSQEMAEHNSPEAMPDRNIALLCPTAGKENGHFDLQLFRFNPGSGRIQAELAGRNFTRIRSAPNGQGIIAQEVKTIGGDEIITRFIYWHDNTARILHEEILPETVFAALSWQVHEEEQRLLIVQSDLDGRVYTFTIVDLSGCAEGSCPKTRQEMIGSPLWSPDGSQYLIKSGNILWWRLLNGSEVIQEPLGLGTVPFWVDNNTFGYVQTGENRIQQIVTASPGDEEMTVVLDSERLLSMFMVENRPEQLMIGYIGVDPAPRARDINRWTIMAFEWFSNGNLGQAYIFSYDPVIDALTFRLQSDQLHSFNVSPNGRWLAAALYDDDLASWRLKIEPVVLGQEVTLLPWQAVAEAEPLQYDWTADSQWLLVLHRGVLTLHSPETVTTQLAPPPIPACVQAAWMD